MAGQFAAVGHFGQRMFSQDGESWSAPVLGKEGEVYRAIAYGNGVFVTVGSYGGNNIVAATVSGEKAGGPAQDGAKSDSGPAWKSASRDAMYSKYLRGLTYGNGMFIGCGGDPGSVGSSNPFVMTTADGQTWSEIIPIAGREIIRRITFGNGIFVAVGDRGRRASSTDAREWKDTPKVSAIHTLVDVAFGKDIFVGVGLHGLRMTSRDGSTWSEPVRGEEGEHLNSIVWAGDRFVACGTQATYTSPDGLAWQRFTNENGPQTMTYGDGVFVGANWKGRILRSTDAIRWKEVHKSEHHVEAIGWGG